MASKFLVIAFILVLCAATTNCQIASGNLFTVISQTAGMNKFSSYLQQANLDIFLNNPATFTVFAWNDTAFNALPSERRIELQSMASSGSGEEHIKFHDFMKSHILFGVRLDTTSMTNEGTRSTISGRDVYFNKIARRFDNSFGSSRVEQYYVNGAMIWKPGQLAANGIFHILDRVFEMPSIKTAFGYIGYPDSTRVHTSRFYDLVNRYLSGEYYGTIMDVNDPNKKVTMFLPSDKAMAKIPVAKLQELQENSTKLNEVVKKHIIPDRVIFTSIVYHNQGYPSIDPSHQITFRKPYYDKVYVNSGDVNAEVTIGNITCSNGVVHVIDTMLGFVYYTAQQELQKGATQPVPTFPACSQSDVDYIASNLDVQFDVIDNLQDGTASFIANISLKNGGAAPIKGGNWKIYMFQIRLVAPSAYPYPDGYIIPDTGFKLHHISGSLYSMEPVEGMFQSLNAGDEIVLRLKLSYWDVAVTDNMPNWYISAEGMTAKLIESTKGESLEFIGPFDTEKKFKRYSEDKYYPFTVRARYALNDVVDDLGDSGYSIIPTPLQVTMDTSRTVSLIADNTWTVVNSADFPRESQFLASKLRLSLKDEAPSKRYIVFQNARVSTGTSRDHPEAYSLRIDTDKEIIQISSQTGAGAYYGVQSLLSLAAKRPDTATVPEATISDWPRFDYRGMHMDVGRNFHNKHDVMKLLDVMATYKLNRFHFHLSDDEGWRLEIPGLEELTTIGSRRCHDPKELKCISPQIGSGPDDSTSGSGYFTKEAYREILQYANDRHIEVIPEFDMPGHARAAIKAMQAREQKFLNVGNLNAAHEYQLTEDGDTSQYISVQWFFDNAMNPCLNSTYAFIEKIMKEVQKLHAGIQPLKTYHFGGDEVAKGAWENSSVCQEFMKGNSHINDVSGLKWYFAKRVSSIAKSLGVNIGAWEDGLLGPDHNPYNHTQLADVDVYGNAWNNVWEWGASDRAYKLANAGYKVILSQATHLFFDHPYEPDPEERGYYWATRFTDTRKTFYFMPDDLYANADFTRAGDPVTMEQVCGGDTCLKLTKPENIIGMQGQLWSETSRTSSELDAMIFPRLLGLAERAWHKAGWEAIVDKEQRNVQRLEDWTKFANTLGYKELDRLDGFGVNYRVPLPGSVVHKRKLKVNVGFPGMQVEYSKDGGKTWLSAAGEPTLPKGTTIYMRTRSKNGSRYSRQVSWTTKSRHFKRKHIRL